ncbi:Uncharacterized conserved protein, DUF433 family [Seinonella peptonophila]|uniref:Uncharacterized conserved protein, DUF433 family n=1 Tax=Seinonella peptonophila TaxID=112248 RepID=A0A1M4ZYV9_9BACL|nr:DUF433 domain-containing protein [Seinonella peptonophila]SHF23027.1 Uncharacterized conserved protein, DUF433 family [Seinonella peptonophila]
MDARAYLNEIAQDYVSITCNKKIVGGMPAIKGTRIQVSLILACLRDKMSIEEICEDYHLSSDNIKKAMEYAIAVLDRPFL